MTWERINGTVKATRLWGGYGGGGGKPPLCCIGEGPAPLPAGDGVVAFRPTVDVVASGPHCCRHELLTLCDGAAVHVYFSLL